MKKYLTSKWIDGISTMEIDRESEKCVWLKTSWGKPTRRLKASGSEIFHDTWKEAREMLIGRAERRYGAAQKNLERMRLELKAAKALPDDESETTGGRKGLP